MRVLHLLDTIDPAGAGPVEAARLYCMAARHDYCPEVLSLDHNVDQWRSSWPVPVHAVGRSRLLPRYSPALVPWLRENGSRFDAIVVHSVWGYHLVGAWRALRPNVPYFLILHGALNPWFRNAYPLKHLKKGAFWWALIDKAVAGAKAVFYLCHEEKRIADPAFSIRSPGEAFVPLGTLPRRRSPEPFLERFPSLRGKRILLFLGRICYMKGCDILLDAFAEAVAESTSGAHLVICGTDHEQWQATLIQRAERLGIADRVTWIGPLFGDDRWPAMSAAELLVLPSRCDTFPIVVLEALSCGTPVLVTREVNIHPQIEETSAGLVCEASQGDVASAIRTWLAHSVAEREAFAERAAKCHLRNFDLRRVVEIHLEAIRKNLLASRKESIESIRAGA
jgi:glycosyltransferase involved in cell wall biosynthesis